MDFESYDTSDKSYFQVRAAYGYSSEGHHIYRVSTGHNEVCFSCSCNQVATSMQDAFHCCYNCARIGGCFQYYHTKDNKFTSKRYSCADCWPTRLPYFSDRLDGAYTGSSGRCPQCRSMNDNLPLYQSKRERVCFTCFFINTELDVNNKKCKLSEEYVKDLDFLCDEELEDSDSASSVDIENKNK